jgi:hypothetical protein
MKPLELKKISDKMGHDLSTQSNYKWDVSQLNTKESANEADDDED